MTPALEANASAGQRESQYLSRMSCTFRLRDLPLLARFGMTALVVVFLIGYWASTQHIVLHHQNRDGEPGLSMTDIIGAYHGISVPSPLRTALIEGHPAELSDSVRAALVKWLDGDSAAISRSYDDLDLGDLAPSELLAANCLQCHGQAEAATKGAGVALQNWELVKKVAFAKQIDPAPFPILINSTHAHALTMAAIGALLLLLVACSRCPRWLLGLMGFGIGVGLLCDVGGWWAARSNVAFVYAIVAGGAAFNVGSVMALLTIFAELWLPRAALRPSAGEAARS